MASCLVRHVNFSRDIRRHLFLDSGQIIDEHLGIVILMDMHWFSDSRADTNFLEIR